MRWFKRSPRQSEKGSFLSGSISCSAAQGDIFVGVTRIEGQRYAD
jgi:hypothetical protein